MWKASSAWRKKSVKIRANRNNNFNQFQQHVSTTTGAQLGTSSKHIQAGSSDRCCDFRWFSDAQAHAKSNETVDGIRLI
jgi:hypothetical protein